MNSSTSTDAIVVGNGDYQYVAVPDWPRLPEDWSFVEATSVATDGAGRILVFNRGTHPLIIFDSSGKVIDNWGEGRFVRPHGITLTDEGYVWLTDDSDHTVQKYSLDGQRLLTLGRHGQASDTGAEGIDYRTIRRSGPPFNFPTNVAVAANGELYVADGYGNARIHRFAPDGQLIMSWGEPGSGAGQFHVPHGIAIDASGVVYVADRENSRLQRFDANGRFIDQWTDIARPCQVFIDASGIVYVAELGYRAGMWPGTVAPQADATGGRVSIFDDRGALLARWGGGANPCAIDDFFAPHDITVDLHGNIYVAEVTWSAGGRLGIVPADCPSLRKFEKIKQLSQG